MSEQRSTELNELFKALSIAQSEINVALKSSSNPFFKSSYANLQSIIESSRPALCKQGLSVLQQMVSENGTDYLVTVLGHSSGQWISSRMKVTPQKSDPQSLGSYITYLRRYMYAALVGVYDGEDDDGNHASLASDIQIKTIQSYTNTNTTLLQQILSNYGIKDIRQLKEADAQQLIIRLSK